MCIHFLFSFDQRLGFACIAATETLERCSLISITSLRCRSDGVPKRLLLLVMTVVLLDKLLRSLPAHVNALQSTRRRPKVALHCFMVPVSYSTKMQLI